ncbi:MAG: DUF559 domain-containing protein [Alphaproteobacteria bacterium]|nr:DUF559 domain-containing protein [Alphaproteobacteria bacterium]
MANERARHLRREATPQERRLWQHLRLLKNDGFHFRRQVPLGPFIVDFACLSARLIIEIDGDQHGRGTAPAEDAARTAFLEREGFRVIRFWNGEVNENLPGVIDRVRHQLRLAI